MTETKAKKKPIFLNDCDSCGKSASLFEVTDKQGRSWHYCDICLAAHQKENQLNMDLITISNTHPGAAESPEVVKLLQSGVGVEDIKRQLDLNKQPELEAEVVS